MKTPIKSLIMAAAAASLALAAHAQYTGSYLPGNPFAAPSAANTVLRNSEFHSAVTGVFHEDLYMNSTLGVTDVFTNWHNGSLNLGSKFAAGGGQVRVIYLGKTAGWQNDFGYVTIPPIPHSAYYEIATDINGVNPAPGSESIISYAAGQKLDFFANSGGPTGQGGLFYALGLGNEFAGTDSSLHIHWNSALLPTADFGSLWTYFIGYEDERTTYSLYDHDFNDLMVAIQFIPTAVPEPSTYGLIGAAALLGLIAYRRQKNKAVAKAATPV